VGDASTGAGLGVAGADGSPGKETEKGHPGRDRVQGIRGKSLATEENGQNEKKASELQVENHLVRELRSCQQLTSEKKAG